MIQPVQVVRSESPLFEAYSALLEAVPRGENTACIDGIRYATKRYMKVQKTLYESAENIISSETQ